MLLKTVLDKTMDIVYPHRCPVCNILIPNPKEKYLCKKCQAQIYLNQPPYCKLCGIHLSNTKKICKICADFLAKRNYKIWYDKIISYFLYKDTLRDILHIIKYQNDLRLTQHIGNIFANTIINDKMINNIDYLISAPLHFKKKLSRGFDQAHIFAQIISKKTNTKLLTGLIYRKKYTIPQSGLSKLKRIENVKNAFAVSNKCDISKSNILLIDDIFTTGATVNECAKVLKKHGAKKVLVATLARG